MAVKVSHLIAGLVGVLVLVGAAFSFGMQWGGEEKSNTEVAAATSALPDSAATSSDETEEEDLETELYDVVKVVDGDTIAISKNGKNETVRLIGIDTPETVDTRVEVQCFGKESSDKLKSLLNGRRVELEIDESEGARDKYKRLLAYVFRDDGLFVNKYMVEEGFAYEYTYDSAYKYQKEFKAAEVDAEKVKKGLWAPNACPEPEVKGASTATKKEDTAPAALPPAPKDPEPKPEPTEEPKSPPAPSGSYTCSSNKYNCTDFKTHAEAQAIFDQCGGAGNDVHKLDSNKDGEACESLP